MDAPDHRQLIDYWDGLRGERFAPAWREWNWMKIPLNLVPYCFVVDVIQEPLDFQYRFWGTAHADIHGIDYTGRKVSDIVPVEVANLSHAQYEESYHQRKPIVYLHEMMVGPFKMPRIQTSLRLPLSSDGDHVDTILSFADWRDIHQDMVKFFEGFRRESR